MSEIVNSILKNYLQFVLLQYLLLALASSYLVNLKKNNLNLLILSSSSIFATIIYIEINLFATVPFWLILVYLLYINIRSLELAILFPSIAFLLYVFSNYVVDGILFLFGLEVSLNLEVTYISLFYLISVYFLKKIFFLFKTKIQISNTIQWIISILAIFVFISYFTIIAIERFKGYMISMEQANAIFIIVYGIVFLLVYLMLLYTNQKELTVKQQRYEMEYLKEYMEKLEKNNQEMRTFKHDYQNILLSLEDYISQKDLKGLEIYFFENIKETSKIMDSNFLKLSQLASLEIQEIKSLLANKLMIAQEYGIDTEIEIRERISGFNVDSLALVRSLGIILDNAVESAMEQNKGEIRVGIIKRDQENLIIVTNSCGVLPKLHLLKQEGYSSKGENRGIGLNNLDRIIQGEKNLVLDTEIKDGMFSQILIIKG
ncbi:two-component system, LytTR family, sensor histidine kinase AgrC [Enterococcus sp. AZ194]|uniref:sensor histidine kinase n=1 Tax=Enterococcus sp. AZ194 TaxID=2774629 RepID=UPI003F29CE42